MDTANLADKRKNRGSREVGLSAPEVTTDAKGRTSVNFNRAMVRSLAPGDKFATSDNAIYEVRPDGSFRRTTKQVHMSKKARRRHRLGK